MMADTRKCARRGIAVAFGAALALAGLVQAALAAPIPFSGETHDYQLQEEPLPIFLQRLFADENINVDLSPAVQAESGTLNGPRQGEAARILASVLGSFNLAAYYDGDSVHVLKRNELTSRYFNLPSERSGEFLGAVRNLGMSNDVNTVRVDSGLVSVSGAPAFVDRVAQIGQAMGQRRVTTTNNGATVFRFFPLKFAWASDRSFVVSNRQVVIPGVATILQQLLDDGGGNRGIGGFQSPSEQQLPATAPSLNGQGLAAVGNSNNFAGAGRTFMTDNSGGLRMVPGGAPVSQSPQMMAYSTSSGARIVADPYRNAVIVRDTPDRVALYEDLIRSLDVESPIMEIVATIIDVDTDKLRELGVEWRYGSKKFESVLGNAEGSKGDFVNSMLSGNIAALGQVPGFQLGAIIGDENRFIARVNALQTEGAMRVVSRPQVVTINDVEATIESSRQIYVPVNGAFQVDLFNVYAGTVLRVTPHLISENARERIRMMVTVEDGDLKLSTQGSNTNVPEVVRNAVTTQAVIEAGQSLLLGGLIRDSASTTVTKVPLLGDLPLIGELFKSRSRDAAHIERLFLISPRMLDQQRPQVPPVPLPELDSRRPTPNPQVLQAPSQLPAMPPPDWIQSGQPVPVPVPEPQPGQVVVPPPPAPAPAPVATAATPTVAVAPPPTATLPPPKSAPPPIALESPPPPPTAPTMAPQPAPTVAAPPLPPPVPAPAPTSQAFVVHSARGLKVRYQPSDKTQSVAILADGSVAHATGQTRQDDSGRQWTEVLAEDASKEAVVGWAASEFLEPATPPASDATQAQGVRP